MARLQQGCKTNRRSTAEATTESVLLAGEKRTRSQRSDQSADDEDFLGLGERAKRPRLEPDASEECTVRVGHDSARSVKVKVKASDDSSGQTGQVNRSQEIAAQAKEKAQEGRQPRPFNDPESKTLTPPTSPTQLADDGDPKGRDFARGFEKLMV